MTEAAATRSFGAWLRENVLLDMTFSDYLRSLITPGNLVVAAILAVGLPVIVYRFAFGLGAATHLSQLNPWGIWIGFDMLSGVALAAGGFTLASCVYLFGLKQFQPIVRPALLTGFLGYVFAVIGLIADLGRPWKLPVPLVWSYGTGSVMFEVAWCIALYTFVLALEFTPMLFEWLGLRKLREWSVQLTIGLTVLAVCLSTLHQSSLGALFLLAPHRLHPLWYSGFVPIFFFVSAIAAGLSMVIVESSLSHRLFHDRFDPDKPVDLDRITISLSKGASVVLFAYLFLKIQGLVDSGRYDLLLTPYGYWFLFEVIGFVAIPCGLFAWAARHGRVTILRATAAWTVLGIVVNRLNISVIAMNWNSPNRYVPSWMEVVTSLTIVTIGVMVFRWIVNRMPVLKQHPAFEAH